MDRYVSASEAARELGTNVPRVLRAARRLDLPIRRGPRGSILLTQNELSRLRQRLGAGASAPGLSRVETYVLAALARAPRGLPSLRAVARRAGVSPTAAAKAVRLLAERGLVRSTRVRAALGRAREVAVVRAHVAAPEWSSLAPYLAAVELPAARRRRRARCVPVELRHLFWNTAASQLDTRRAGGYIARRLLATADLDGLAWGAENLRPEDWRHAAAARGLEPKLRALALNLAEQPA